MYWVGPLCGGALAAFLYLVAFDWVDKNKSERHDFKQEISTEGKVKTGVRYVVRYDVRYSVR